MDDLSNVWAVGVAHYAVSDTGTLVFASESLGDRWPVDDGRPIAAAPQTLPVPKRLYVDPVVSPNGRFVAVEDYDDGRRHLVIDLQTGAPQRLTFNDDEDETPVWSPDGVWVAYASDRRSGRQILRRRADGGGAEESLWTGKPHLHVEDWTGDGRYLVTSGSRMGPRLRSSTSQAKPPALRPLMPAQGGIEQCARLSAMAGGSLHAAANRAVRRSTCRTFRSSAHAGRSRKAAASTRCGRPTAARSSTAAVRPCFACRSNDGSALSFSRPRANFPSLPGVKGNHRSWTVMPNGDVLVLHNKSANQVPSLSVFLNWAGSLLGDAR